MDGRFKLMSFINATAGSASYRVVDIRDGGNPTNMQVYGEKSVAEAALALATKNQLLLGESWNYSNLRLNGALSTDSEGKEVFIGLSHDDSKLYAKLHDGEPTDKFIELDHMHREARAGQNGEAI